KAHSLCGAELGVLLTFDGESFWVAAAHGASARLRDAARHGFRPGPHNPFGRAMRGEEFVQIEDVAELMAQGIDDPELRIAFEIGIRTFLVIPLRQDGKLLGAISANRREVRPFTDKQIALLQNFAAQAVIAMENARLITETQEALEQQTATAEVLGVINSSPGDLAPVFDAILEKAHSLCGVAFGSLQLYDEGKIRAVAVRAVAADLAELLRQPMAPLPGSAASRLLLGERFVQNADILELARRFPDDPRIQLSAARGLRTGLFVPLRKETDFLGYISAFRDQVRPFSEKEIALLENFAAQAVIAMENARLITETREALGQQPATAEELGVINDSLDDIGPAVAALLATGSRLRDAS